MSADSIVIVAVKIKHLSVGIILYISRFAVNRGVIVAYAVLSLPVFQLFIKVVLKYRLRLCILTAYFHLYCNLRTAHSELFIRKIQHRHAFRIKEHRFYISVAACVIQRVSAVSCVFLCRTSMIYNYKIAVLVCCKRVVSRSAELIVKVTAGQYRIRYLCPVGSICQIRIRVCCHQAYAVLRAGSRS